MDREIDNNNNKKKKLFVLLTTDKSKYRLVCWSLSERGAVGETILHLCMLHATAIHIDLAKRLLRFYPKLINDVYISDEYYGWLIYREDENAKKPLFFSFFYLSINFIRRERITHRNRERGSVNGEIPFG